LQFKDVTTGATNDIERATAISRKMVAEWGMSDKVGPLHLSGSDTSSVFLGRDYARGSSHSEEYAKIVDSEVKKIVDGAFTKGRGLLKKHQKKLDALANKLLEQETITGDEVLEVVFGKKFVIKKNSASDKTKGGPSKKEASTGKVAKKSKKKGLPKLDVQPI